MGSSRAGILCRYRGRAVDLRVVGSPWGAHRARRTVSDRPEHYCRRGAASNADVRIAAFRFLDGCRVPRALAGCDLPVAQAGSMVGGSRNRWVRHYWSSWDCPYSSFWIWSVYRLGLGIVRERPRNSATRLPWSSITVMS